MCAAQFIRIFIEKSIHSESITEALDAHESFHVLEALPTLWSPIHLFKCNCSTCFTHASCAHVLLASMVCYHKIEIPMQYVSTTFQVRSKRGRPAVSGQNMETPPRLSRTELEHLSAVACEATKLGWTFSK